MQIPSTRWMTWGDTQSLWRCNIVSCIIQLDFIETLVHRNFSSFSHWASWIFSVCISFSSICYIDSVFGNLFTVFISMYSFNKINDLRRSLADIALKHILSLWRCNIVSCILQLDFIETSIHLEISLPAFSLWRIHFVCSKRLRFNIYLYLFWPYGGCFFLVCWPRGLYIDEISNYIRVIGWIRSMLNRGSYTHTTVCWWNYVDFQLRSQSRRLLVTKPGVRMLTWVTRNHGLQRHLNA